MSAITLSPSKIMAHKGIVVIPLSEYRRLLDAAIQTRHLTGKAALRLDKLVEDGLREYREGKTISAGSLSEAVKKFKHAR
ncbi:MAG: hypothetical protein AAB798_02020 [Patescibacteria group bacterium]